MKFPVLLVYLLALLLIGVGYLAIMPVNEGFDENAHYSSLRQIADTGTIPVYGKARLDRAMTHYDGPVAYSSLSPPFDVNMSYARFFKDPAMAESYVRANRQSGVRALYQPADDEKALNWQAQHPPTYYLLLAPLTRMTDDLPLVTQVLLLRLASFMLALVGVALGFLAVTRRNFSLKNPAISGFLLYPIILPMFFPEFTRLGNDSFCLFLTGLAAFLISCWLDQPQNKKWLLAVGATLGLGLLTKAFFLPISAGVGLFMLLRFLSVRRDVTQRSGRFWDVVLVFVPALLIGGGWYAYKFFAFGDLTGSSDAIRVAQHGGLIANLKLHFSLMALPAVFLVTLVSWSWAGTWSLTRLPEWMQLPSVLLAVWIVIAFLKELRRRPMDDAAWLPVWTFGLFAGSLFYYAILTIALDGNGGAPGWYLHILMPWVAPALGIGISSILQQRVARKLLIGLLVYTGLFQAAVCWSQLALFTGCATKGDNKHYLFSGTAFCLDQVPLIIDRLAVIGWPVLAVLGFGGGIVCALGLLCGIRRNIKNEAVLNPIDSN